MDWSGCPIILSRPDYLGGTPALRDDPRIPAELVVANIDDSNPEDIRLAAIELIEEYELRTPLCDVLAVYEYAATQRGAGPI